MSSVLTMPASLRRPRLSQERLLLLFSALITLSCNGLFWQALVVGRDFGVARNWMFLAATAVTVIAIHFVLFALLSTRRSIRPLLGLIWMVSGIAMLYMQQYTVFLDASMLRNVLHTQVKEARELLSISLLLKALLWAVPGWALLAWIEIEPRRWRQGLLRRGLALALAMLAALAGALLGYQELSSLLRNQREVRYLVTPANLIVSTVRVLMDDARESSRPRQPIGEDVQPLAGPARRPRLLVLVVGETVRSEDWGLSGYERQTTPELAQRAVVNFADVTACGSNTEVSVPCMFAPVGRRDYDERRIRGQQSLLHVLDRAGIATDWIDNQTGCKGVCDGLPREDVRGDEDAQLCDGKVCLDEWLIRRVAARLDGAAEQDRIIVLHPLGNHGPNYSHRYPAAFRRFTPTCESAEFGDCTQEEIRNSYDNAILYTDHVLAGLIDLLAAQNNYDAGLLYLSDHGESLGEHGLYLHGVPYAIAPAQQVKVPMTLWLSPALQQTLGLSNACLAGHSQTAYSHDHLFHSVFGLFDLHSTIYDANLDIFAGCRPPRSATAEAAATSAQERA